MQAIKIFLAVVFSIGAIGGFTSVGGIQDSSSKSQTLLFAVAFALIAIGCILSFKKGREKQAIKAFQKQEEEKAFAEAQRQREDRMQKALSMSTLPVEQYPEAIILNAGEICHYQIPAVAVVVKNQVVGRTGGSGGVSVRVAKGVTLHSGRSAGKTIRDDVPYFYGGVFSITNQRIIMTGESSFEHPVNKLTSITPYSCVSGDGVTLQFGRTTHNLLVDEPYWISKIVELIRSGAPVEA